MREIPTGLERIYQYCEGIGIEGTRTYIKSLDVDEKLVKQFYVSARCILMPGWSEGNIESMPTGKIILYHPEGGGVRLPKYSFPENQAENAALKAEREGDERVLEDIYHEVSHALTSYASWVATTGARDKLKEEGVAEFYGKFMKAYSKLENKNDAVKAARVQIVSELLKLKDFRVSNDEEQEYYQKKLGNLIAALEACDTVTKDREPEDLIFSDYMLPKGLK